MWCYCRYIFFFLILSCFHVHILGTLQSKIGNIHDDLVEKCTLDPFKIFCNLKSLHLSLDSEFIALPLPFSSKLKIWPFHVAVVQKQQRILQKGVINVQSTVVLLCCSSFVRSLLIGRGKEGKCPWVKKKSNPTKRCIPHCLDRKYYFRSWRKRSSQCIMDHFLWKHGRFIVYLRVGGHNDR